MAELAKILGNPLYLFNCSTSTNRETLVDIFRGLACSGEFISRFVSATSKDVMQINKTTSALRKKQEINYILQRVTMRRASFPGSLSFAFQGERGREDFFCKSVVKQNCVFCCL